MDSDKLDRWNDSGIHAEDWKKEETEIEEKPDGDSAGEESEEEEEEEEA